MKSKAPSLRFSGVLKDGDGARRIFEKLYELETSKDGNDLVIIDRSARRVLDTTGALVMKHQLRLDEKDDAANARAMRSQIQEDEFSGVRSEQGIAIYPGGGSHAETATATNAVLMCPIDDFELNVTELLFPLMRKRYGSKSVTGVVADLSRLQKSISVLKFLLLLEQYSPEQVKDLITSKSAFLGAIPLSFDVLSYVEALTNLGAVSMSLPARRANCAWHFQGNGMTVFDPPGRYGLIELFVLRSNPMAKTPILLGVDEIKGMNEDRVWQYLKFVVEGVDRLFAYVLNPFSFANDAGTVDIGRQIQTLSAIHFLFGDLQSQNLSVVSNTRLTFAMTIIDRLSNLALSGTGSSADEATVFKALCSAEQGRRVSAAIAQRCRSLGYDQLSEILANAVAVSFANLHRQLGIQNPDEADTESNRLGRLRMQRNMRHGAFLQHGQFTKLFYESSGLLPESLVSVATYLVLGLISDPGKFMSERPSASTQP